MPQTDRLLATFTEIQILNKNGLLYHKHRFATLTNRVEKVVDLIKSNASDTRDISLLQAMDILNTTLDEVKDLMLVFRLKNANLANHIVMYGSDEEQFVKWNERLQHCVDSLGQSGKISDVFDQNVDLQNFEDDMKVLRADLLELVMLILKGKDTVNAVALRKSLEGLLGHQSDIRATYQTKTSPKEALEIDPLKVKYEVIIGRGGNSL